MSTSDNADTQDTKKEETPTFEKKVLNAVDKAKDPKTGAYALEEGLPEEITVAAKAEIKYRETQSSYTKGQQEFKQLKIVNDKQVAQINVLSSNVPKVDVNIPENRREELETLKEDNPEAWRQAINKLEDEQTSAASNELKSKTDKAEKDIEIARRQTALAEFRVKNPAIEVTDEFIANEVPPRYVKELDEGKVTFEQFLENVSKFAPPGTSIATDSLDAQDDLGKLAGGGDPSVEAQRGEEATTYEDEIY